jgi:hypothetical protein
MTRSALALELPTPLAVAQVLVLGFMILTVIFILPL